MFEIGLVLVCFLFFFMSIVTHEVAHGWVAYRCGDPTARNQGRVTFNPVVHVDPIFSILVPVVCYATLGFPFGGARPIPVEKRNLRHEKLGDFLVTVAGPASNFAIAAVFALLMHVPLFGERTPDNAAMVLMGVTVYVNLFLGVFNLIPLPPLDGSHVAALLMPKWLRTAYQQIGSWGILILLVLILRVPAFGDGILNVVDSIVEAFGHSRELMAGIKNSFVGLRPRILGS